MKFNQSACLQPRMNHFPQIFINWISSFWCIPSWIASVASCIRIRMIEIDSNTMIGFCNQFEFFLAVFFLNLAHSMNFKTCIHYVAFNKFQWREMPRLLIIIGCVGPRLHFFVPNEVDWFLNMKEIERIEVRNWISRLRGDKVIE